MNPIYLFIASLGSGGAEHQLSVLGNLLVEHYDVTIVTFANVEDHYSLDDGIKRVKLNRKNKWLTFISCFLFFLNLKKGCVISFGQRENFICLIPLCFNHKVKIISSDRNTSLGKPTIIEKLLGNFLYARANYIVPNSHTQTKYLKNKYLKLKDKLVTITNYTDLVNYKMLPFAKNKMVKIGIFCRYEQQKNYHRFVLAIEELVNRGHNDFLIEWYGSQKLLSATHPGYLEMKKIVEDKGLSKYIKLNDAIHDVAGKMSQMDVICLPSLYEGFSNTVSEGICCGRPMLVSNVSDNSLMVHDGENGFLFNPLNVLDMADKIEEMINLSVEQKTQMGIKSRLIAENLFDKDKFKNSYIKLIES